MTVEEILNQIARPATKFKTGGFKPENTLEESWIGKVTAYRQDEDIPVDKNGELMMPLAQLYISDLPYIPPALQDTKLITVFIAGDFPEQLDPMGDYWVLREYKDLTEIETKNLINPDSFLRPFPLKPGLVEKDYPIWDGGGLTPDMEDEILKLEREGVINDYYDIAKHAYDHKIGGYPSFCQSGIGITDGFGEGFEFVFQISSDEKARLNVVDNGSLMFAKNIETGEWSIYYDFY